MSGAENTTQYMGSYGSLALFAMGDSAAVLDLDCNLIVESGDTQELSASKDWFTLASSEIPKSAYELAEASLSSLNVNIIVAAGDSRLYTIPKGAQAEAKKALEWRKEHHRGGTPVGLNTARTLARGGQIGIQKIRHIAKYFPRHEVDKKGKGWAPGEDNFPSNGRIAWALWGGDTAWSWARAIVERENKAATTAGGYILEEATNESIDLDAFRKSMYLSPSSAPEFLARVRMDGSGIDRIYKIDIDGSVYVWDDGCWDSLGDVDSDVWTYDKALDDPYDTVEKSHVPIDPDSAIIVCAKMHQNPYDRISIEEIDAEEAALAIFAAREMDWDFLDNTLTAAGVNPNDNIYSPEERSQNATKQIRNALGRFAQQGQKVVIGNDASNRGTITNANVGNGNVEVTGADGSKQIVSGKDTVEEKDFKEPLPFSDLDKPLDLSGILGEPRTPIDRPYARIPGTLPALTKGDLHDLLYNWSGWVQSQRAAATEAGFTAAAESEDSEEVEEVSEHPLITRWKKSSQGAPKVTEEEEGWASPVVAAPVVKKSAKKTYQMTPETSDVQPLYMAIVAEDDPRAVLDLIALVPASSTSSEPMTYKRDAGKWVRDEVTLNDLKSATPPPVVPLDKTVLNDVLTQVDEATITAAGIFNMDHLMMVLWGPQQDIMDTFGQQFFDSIDENTKLQDTFKSVLSVTAAGGLDRNRGNAEKLRRYWTRGEGAAKIRWGTSGDWARCVRHLGKYLGPRAKGYCQLRHKEALGYYTSTHAKKDRAKNNSNQEFIMEEVLTKNYGKPTVVPDKDMLTPIEKIMEAHDDIYFSDWGPTYEIIEALEELAKCGDAEFEALIAAGGLDRNRGNAEKLRRYWTKGKGAAKIRWGTGGDWTRCVRHLSKYLGPRAKGYCALRHHEVTGQWTGDKTHREMYGKRGGKRNVFSTELLNSTSLVIAKGELSARAEAAKERLGMTASADMASHGARFHIPLVIPEGIESGDGRKFNKGSITLRELPLPLLWQIKTGDGHNGAVVVGRIDSVERTNEGIGNAYGVLDNGPYGREVERLIKNGFLRGVSADMDKFEATEDKRETAAAEDEKEIGKSKLTINKARVMAVTIVPKPAFQECKITLIDDNPTINSTYQEETMIPDGVYVDDADASDAQALVACGIVAGAIPVVPPTEWFENPKLKGPTPLTVDDMGRVFGHIAAWHVDHIGMAYGTKPPRSKSNYAYFHTGVVRTDNGTDVPVGQLTLAGGHASLEASAMEAVKHYDDTASAIADVHAGEDSYGIWVAGSLRPEAKPEQIRALRASAPSGDWRPIRGALELVAVCQVNVPGFPIARARVASGAVMALVAAGASTLAKLKADPIAEMASRIERLEKITTPKDELEARVASLKAKVDEAKSEFGYISRDERNKLAEEGMALPDGSYPIRNLEDLKNAIQAYGRSKAEDRKAVRNHIKKRARQLNQRHLVPENWKNLESESITASAEDLRNRLAAAQEALGKTFAVDEIPVEDVPIVDEGMPTDAIDVAPGKYVPGVNQPRDIKGRFRDVLARLKEDLGDSELSDVNQKIKEAEKISGLGDYQDAAKAGQELLGLLDRLDEGSLNKVSLENVRATAAELGKVISNLPLPFTNQAQKVRFSDLPPALRNLMKNMVERVEKKIGKEDAAKATENLKGFMSGSDVYSQSDISSQMATMLRLLT